MVVEFTLTASLLGEVLAAYKVGAVAKEKDGRMRVWFDVIETGTDKVIADGVFDGPRANHPHFAGRVAAMVLERAFRFVPENRYKLTPRHEQHDNPTINHTR